MKSFLGQLKYSRFVFYQIQKSRLRLEFLNPDKAALLAF